MFHQIVSFTQESGLDAEPGFRPKIAKWAISCSTQGAYLGLISLKSGDLPGREFPKCPDLTQPEMKAGGITKSHFLLDALGVIAGVADKPKEEEKNALKHAYFWNLITESANEVPELSVAAAISKDSLALDRLRADMVANKAKPTDTATFFCIDHFPIEREHWHGWWRKQRTRYASAPKTTATGSVPCFLTGELVTPVPTHEKIKGLADVGGIAMGDVLIGFKQESFCSYGFEQSANAAMSVESAKAYVSGLNELIYRQSKRLAGTKQVFWFKKPVPLEDDPFPFLQQGDDSDKTSALSRMKQLLTAIDAGERPDLGSNDYYGLELSSNGGRVVVRSWWEGTYRQLLRNILQWFEDLSISRPLQGISPPPKFFSVLAAMERDADNIVAPLQIALWRAAVSGSAIPEAVHVKTLLRVRARVLSGDGITYFQAGLLKAFHRRKGSFMVEKEVTLDGPLPYQCGRLLAVLANLQYAALGDVGAGVVARFYPAASSTPSLVLGRLIMNAQNHLQKLRGEKPALAYWYDAQMREIISSIPSHELPKTFTLEQQSMFALGFYQQKANTGKKD